MTAQAPSDSLVTLADIMEIELLILKRVHEVTIGEHRSTRHGAGFDFVGLRNWEAGDSLSSINWPQSTITNFSPLIVSDFEQPSTAGVIAVADGSLSTRCGVGGTPIAALVARAIATMGMSSVFFQDAFGLITFGAGFLEVSAVRPRVGKGHVIHCLNAYAADQSSVRVRIAGSISATLTGAIRRTSLVPVISDFLFDKPHEVLAELALVDAMHDVVIVLVDSAFAFELPRLSAAWVEAFDVESGRTRTMSRRRLAELAGRVRTWQDEVERTAKSMDLTVLRLGTDRDRSEIALLDFVIERRLQRA